jgi:hypothetical protein
MKMVTALVLDGGSRRAVAQIAILTAGLVLACHGDGGDAHAAFLDVAPQDGTTGLTAPSVQIRVGTTEGSRLEAISKGLSLATWPDLSAVPASTTISTPVGLGAICVDSTSAVPEGWYVAIVGERAGAVADEPTGFHTLPDGRLGVRVRVGSSPAVWGIVVCAKSATDVVVLVRYTEFVRAVGTEPYPARVTAGAPGQEPALCQRMWTPEAGAATNEIPYLCSGLSFVEGVDVTITVLSGLASFLGSVPLQPTTLTAPAAGQASGGEPGCRYFKFDPSGG